MRYLKDAEIIAAFGDPTSHLLEDGHVGGSWPISILTTIELPAPLKLSWDPRKSVTKIRCHKRIAERMKLALDTIWTVPAVWASINDFGGCYAWRAIRGAKSLSRHCWGVAIDLDVRDNPLGSMGATHQFVKDAFKAQGFMWGGDFSRPDPMHFEFADPDFLGV